MKGSLIIHDRLNEATHMFMGLEEFQLLDLAEGKSVNVLYGVAKKHPDDQYNKKAGVKVAFSKLQHRTIQADRVLVDFKKDEMILQLTIDEYSYKLIKTGNRNYIYATLNWGIF